MQETEKQKKEGKSKVEHQKLKVAGCVVALVMTGAGRSSNRDDEDRKKYTDAKIAEFSAAMCKMELARLQLQEGNVLFDQCHQGDLLK